MGSFLRQTGPHCLLPLSPAVAFITPVGLWIPLSLMALWGIFLYRPSVREIWNFNPWLWGVVSFGLVVSFLSLTPGHSAVTAVRIGAICIAGVVVVDNLRHISDEQVGKIAFWTLCVAVAIGAIAIYDIRSDASLSGVLRTAEARANVPHGIPYSRGAAFLALLLFPCVALSWQTAYRRVAVTIGCVACIILTQHSSETAMGAVFLGGVAALKVAVIPKLFRWVPYVLAAFIIMVPWAVPKPDGTLSCFTAEHAPSMAHRVMIWNFVSEKVQERPILGYGLEAERVIEGGRKPISLTGCESDPFFPMEGKDGMSFHEALPLHPHNGPLHIWLDLGAIGVILSVFVLLRAWPQCASRISAVAMAGGAISAFVVINLGYGLWQTWFLSGLWIMSALMAAACRAGQSRGYESQVGGAYEQKEGEIKT